MKTVLVLGNGYVANKLQDNWKIDANIIVVSRSEFDYLDVNAFNKLIGKYLPDYIVNCYGYTGKPNVDSCEDNVTECVQRNVFDQRKIFALAKNEGIPVISISSGCIYNDETGKRTFKEDDTPNFGQTNPTASVYSKSKAAFDKEFQRSYAADNYLLRIRMPYDHNLGDDKNYLGKILKYNKLVNYQNSLTHVKYLTRVVETIVEDDVETGVYNVVDTGGINAEDILEIAAEYNHFHNITKWYSTDDMLSESIMKCRRSNCVLDNAKIRKYVVIPDVRSILLETFEETL